MDNLENAESRAPYVDDNVCGIAGILKQLVSVVEKILLPQKEIRAIQCQPMIKIHRLLIELCSRWRNLN
jgi:hypothetical protein